MEGDPRRRRQRPGSRQQRLWRHAETTATDLAVGGLERCARYVFRIRAVTAAGTGGQVGRDGDDEALVSDC